MYFPESFRSFFRNTRFKFIFAFLITFFLFDFLFFRYLLWKFPNETAWESEPLYNFEYKMRRLLSGKPKDEFRILIIGSSIAAYSVLPEKLMKDLYTSINRKQNFSNKYVQVYMLGRQGMNTLNLLALTDRFLSAEPDIIIFPLNMVDFRLERPLMLHVIKDLSGEKKLKALEQIETDLLAHPEFRIFSPWGVLQCCASHLNWNQRAAALLSIAFGAYRYRDIALSPISRFIANRFTRGHSYLHYAGLPVGGDNVTHRGRTGRNFQLRISAALLRKGLEIEAPEELFQGPKERRPRVSLEIFSGAQPPDVCNRSDGKSALEKRIVPLKRGWQNVALPGSTSVGDILCGRVSPLYYSTLNADFLGIRLARNTGVSYPRRVFDNREIRREDQIYLRYTKQEYVSSFEQRILRFNRTGMEYLHALKLAKEIWATRKFEAALPSVRAFRLFRNNILDAGIPLIVINSPENPISLKWYMNSDWYRGFLNYLATPRTIKEEQYYFFNAVELLPMQHFYDYHHLSYFGAEKFTNWLSGMIIKKVITSRIFNR